MPFRKLPPDFAHSRRPVIAIVLSGVFIVLTAEVGGTRSPITSVIAESPGQNPRSSEALNSSVLKAAPTARNPTAAFDPYIDAASREHGVSHELIRAIIQTESEFDHQAMSPRGACGLMQLMPRTARRFGVVDCFDARENILGGTRYLKLLLTRYDGSVALSIAAYNAGEGAVARHGGIPPYRQTRAYVRKVIDLLAKGSDTRPGRPLATT